MTTATQMQRISKNLKVEALRAMLQIDVDGYRVETDTRRVYDDEDCWYGILFYRNGDEVIAVPTFYLDEEYVSLTGSQGGSYRLDGETVSVD